MQTESATDRLNVLTDLVRMKRGGGNCPHPPLAMLMAPAEQNTNPNLLTLLFLAYFCYFNTPTKRTVPEKKCYLWQPPPLLPFSI